MNIILLRAGVASAIASMVYLIVMLVIKSVPLNLASFGLWLFIDVAIVVAMLRARPEGDHSLPWLMIAYTVGTAVIVLLSLHNLSLGKSTFLWGTSETMTVIAVLVAMLVWYKTSDKWGLIMSTNAMLVATIPTWADALRDPASQDIVFWMLSCGGCFFTAIASPRTLVGCYMPVVGTLSNLLVIMLAARQFL